MIFDQRLPILVPQCKVIDAERTLASSRIVGSQPVFTRSQCNVPFCRQFHIVNVEIASALCIVPPQTLLPQKRAIQRRLHLVQPKIFGRRPDLTPQCNLVVPYRALDNDCVLLDFIARQSAQQNQTRYNKLDA